MNIDELKKDIIKKGEDNIDELKTKIKEMKTSIAFISNMIDDHLADNTFQSKEGKRFNSYVQYINEILEKLHNKFET